jgi:uncharacterized protein DUF1579
MLAIPVDLAGLGAAALALLTALAAGDPTAGPSAEQQAAMEAEMRAAQPGPTHQRLARLAGEWTTLTKLRMAPDQPATEAPGTARLTSGLGGRFLLEESENAPFGPPTTNWRLTGYNNGSGRYEAVWLWTMATGMLTLEGTEGGGAIDWRGGFKDAQGKEQPMHARTRLESDDRFVVEVLGPGPDGREFTVVETTYSRQR